MPTHEPSTKEHPAHGSRQQFYLGFLTGAVIGVGIAFLSASKKSGTLKKDLLNQAKELAGKLPGFIEDLASELDDKSESAGEQLQHVKEVLASDPDGAESAVEPELIRSHKVIAEPSSEDSLTNSVVKTASKAKRFFSKAGKFLRK